jgi:hypothetical protein
MKLTKSNFSTKRISYCRVLITAAVLASAHIVVEVILSRKA